MWHAEGPEQCEVNIRKWGPVGLTTCLREAPLSSSGSSPLPEGTEVQQLLPVNNGDVTSAYSTVARQQEKSFKLTRSSSITSVIFRSNLLVLDWIGRIFESRHFCCSAAPLRLQANGTFPGSWGSWGPNDPFLSSGPPAHSPKPWQNHHVNIRVLKEYILHCQVW